MHDPRSWTQVLEGSFAEFCFCFCCVS